MKRRTKNPIPLVVQVYGNIALNPAEIVSIYGRDGDVEIRMTNGQLFTLFNTTVASVLEKFSMNQKKAKALRRAAKAIAAKFPDVHLKGDTYQDIVKQTIQKVVTRIPPSLMQRARKFFGLKTPPVKTKVVEKVVKETRQLVLTSGVRFILKRLKAAMKRGELLTTDPLFINPHKGTR